jgi:hypothetical protein
MVYNQYGNWIKEVRDQLLDPKKLDARLFAFMTVYVLPSNCPVSVAVNAMA